MKEHTQKVPAVVLADVLGHELLKGGSLSVPLLCVTGPAFKFIVLSSVKIGFSVDIQQKKSVSREKNVCFSKK